LPGFAIAFDTPLKPGNGVDEPQSFVCCRCLRSKRWRASDAATARSSSGGNTRWGGNSRFYLRDEGFRNWGISRFSYQPTRQTLEMTTYYRRSVAVDQMRMVAPDLRLRTIITYQCPTAGEPPSVIDLVGFGVERKQSA